MHASLPPEPASLGLGSGAIVALPADDQTLYRLIRQQQPRAWDFRSNRDRGRPPAPRETALLHCGVSMFSDPEAALSRARRTPVYLAAVTLATGRGLHLAKTGSRSHYTGWGTPEDLAACARPYHSQQR